MTPAVDLTRCGWCLAIGHRTGECPRALATLTRAATRHDAEEATADHA